MLSNLYFFFWIFRFNGLRLEDVSRDKVFLFVNLINKNCVSYCVEVIDLWRIREILFRGLEIGILR